ncbi:MAG TPA: hypothetical protein VGP94_09590 [Tepidisphaeraceae bacterium]|jgi:hypothetical protein|nr:hypothetical protein [Tepidisphaeraceae bacterium]
MRLSQYLHKLFAVVIALTTAGAQVVCACPIASIPLQAPPAIKGCAGEKECCGKSELSKPIQPSKQEPCEKCNLKHRTEQAMPDRQSAPVLPQLDLYSVLPVPVVTLAEVPLQPRLLDTLPLPPLLKDLFHVHSLLLN